MKITQTQLLYITSLVLAMNKAATDQTHDESFKTEPFKMVLEGTTGLPTVKVTAFSISIWESETDETDRDGGEEQLEPYIRRRAQQLVKSISKIQVRD